MFKNAIICVVDDDAGVRESLAAFFRSVGVKVELFPAAEALLGWDGMSRMDCLITDFHMPGMSGLDMQQELIRRGANVPTILMTAFASEEARTSAGKLQVGWFETKPVDPEHLLELVKGVVLDKKRNHDKKRNEPKEAA